MTVKRCLWAAVLTVLCLAAVPALGGCDRREGVRVEPVDLGIPLSEVYSDDTREQRLARRSDDMTVFDGRLYVGGGDYSDNMGPVRVYSMGLSDRLWSASENLLPDEQVKRFAVLDGALCIMGTDPCGNDWSVGNYYILKDGEWVTRAVLPWGIHCFDAVEFDGRTFFGLGVEQGHCPVAVTEDGEVFDAVPFVRDGAAVDTEGCAYVRVYNFSVFGGELYAFLTVGNEGDMDYDVYRYDGESFVYFSTPPEVFRRGYDLYHAVELDGMNAFINGYCYFITEDMVNFRPWRVGDSDLACDVEIIDGMTYVLAYRQLVGGNYEVAVYAAEDGKNFQKKFYFDYEIPANSFAYADGVFYLSMGRYYDADSPQIGRVLAVEWGD